MMGTPGGKIAVSEPGAVGCEINIWVLPVLDRHESAAVSDAGHQDGGGL